MGKTLLTPSNAEGGQRGQKNRVHPLGSEVANGE